MREALGHLQAREGFLYIEVCFRAASKGRDVLCLCSPAVLGEALQAVGWRPAGTQLELRDSASTVCTAPELLQLSNKWAPLETNSCRLSESCLHHLCCLAPVLSL